MTSEPNSRSAPTPGFAASPGGVAAEFEAQLRRVAASPATVLLEGESGSGKSRAARRLHELSPRRDQPFVEVSVNAFSEHLVEAELFGHEEGAFTGAERARLGRFRKAEGGTVLLDGVENLSLDVQVKLLRVLQERVVEPLGGDACPVDVRVIATTSQDLESCVAGGRFRQDLYYRLAVVNLRVPPLRTRTAELPELVRSLTEHVAGRSGTRQRNFSKDALERLESHGWPGNLRELENVIERVLILGGERSDEVQAQELDFLERERQSDARALARQALSHGLDVESMGLAMIEEAVEEQRGNLSAAARQVGLSRRALEYRLRRAEEQEADEPAGGASDEEGSES